MLLAVLFLLTRITLVYSAPNDGDKLILANVLYRHGARSPTRFYPTNPNQVEAWPDGPGRLTKIGINMEYDLGIFLKERYVDTQKFINQSYLHKEVYIRSSSVDRCLQSAESQLAGLYPPTGDQVWKKGLDWQPLPIQTVPSTEDSLLIPGGTDCPRIGKIWKSMLESNELKTKQSENQELLNYISNHSGKAIFLENIWDVTDDLLCEQAQHMNSSKWAMDRFPEILNLSNWAFNFIYQGTDELGRLLGGALLGTMVSTMQKMRNNDVADVHKLNIFSGHDTSLLALTTALNVKFPVPTFSACILIDMYKRPDGEYYVTIDYRNGIENATSMMKMNLTECDYECPLNDFIRLTKKRIPTDRSKECHDPPGFFTKKRLQIVSAVLFALAAFFFIVVVWMCLRKYFRGRRRKQQNQKKRGKAVNFVASDEEDEQANLIT